MICDASIKHSSSFESLSRWWHQDHVHQLKMTLVFLLIARLLLVSHHHAYIDEPKNRRQQQTYSVNLSWIYRCRMNVLVYSVCLKMCRFILTYQLLISSRNIIMQMSAHTHKQIDCIMKSWIISTNKIMGVECWWKR